MLSRRSRRPSQRRALLRLCVIVSSISALIALAACVDLDGLGGGVRPIADASDEAAPLDAAGAGRFCASADAALFCDDFDDEGDGAPGARWLGLEGVVPGTLLSGDAGISRGASPYTPSSPPFALDVFVGRSPGDPRAMAFLDQVVTTPDGRAVEFVAEVRLIELFGANAGPGDAGTTDDGGADAGGDDSGADASGGDGGAAIPPVRIPIMGIGTVATTSVGASLWLSDSRLELRSGVQSFDTKQTASASVANFGFLSAMRSAWITFHLVVGEREVVEARVAAATGLAAKCPTSKAVAAAWSSLPLWSSGCIDLLDELLPLDGQLIAAVLGVTFDPMGRARIQFDNARVDAIR